MTWKLFLDDERDPVDTSYVVCRTSKEAMAQIIDRGLPHDMMLDHDLGGTDTTMELLKWLDFWLDINDLSFPEGFTFSVHSQNPVGKSNIQSFLSNMIEFYEKSNY